MPDDLIGEIKTARQLLREEENRTHDAAIELQNCKQRERKARQALDELLDALEGGERYPLFRTEAAHPAARGPGNGLASTPTAEAGTAPPLQGRGKKGATP
jgi:hypothetical protein